VKDALGREPAGPGVEASPFYAIGPIKLFNIFSAGGLRVGCEMHVLDEQGQPIPHLFAAGVNGESGVFLGGHGHHLAWAFGTGMIAGRNAASEEAR
jgi:predicted oxidoreductase